MSNLIAVLLKLFDTLSKEFYMNLMRKINHEDSTTSLHASLADSKCFCCFFHTE